MFLPAEPFQPQDRDKDLAAISPAHIREPEAIKLSPLTIARMMRRWQAGRTLVDPVQPILYEMLVPLQLEILAPVFDGLFMAFCDALGRPLQTGCGVDLSPDEKVMAALLIGRSTSNTIPSLSLSRAASSAQLMLRLALLEGKSMRP